MALHTLVEARIYMAYIKVTGFQNTQGNIMSSKHILDISRSGGPWSTAQNERTYLLIISRAVYLPVLISPLARKLHKRYQPGICSLPAVYKICI